MYNCRKREKQDEPLWASLANTVVTPEAPALGHCRRVCGVHRSAVRSSVDSSNWSHCAKVEMCRRVFTSTFHSSGGGSAPKEVLYTSNYSK